MNDILAVCQGYQNVEKSVIMELFRPTDLQCNAGKKKTSGRSFSRSRKQGFVM